MRYFASYREALAFAKNAGLTQRPLKRTVWIYPRHEQVWSLDV